MSSSTIDLINSILLKIKQRSSVCYKFWTIQEWTDRKLMDKHDGSEFDKKDGYIHMCTIDQCATIANRYFSDKSEYFIIKMDINKIHKLQWDINNHGIFPHAYTDIPKQAILKIYKINNSQNFDFNAL